MITIKKYSKVNCRPCAALSNYLTEIDLAALNADLIEVDIANLSDEELEALNIASVPVLRFERNGVEVHRIVGLRPTEEIIDAIEHAKVVR